MPPPLRKPRQKTAASPAASDKKRLILRLSAPMATLLGLILMAAVGWSFFMGFMVGRGQNPEQRVEQMTGLQLDKQAQQTAQGGVDAPNTPIAAAAGDQSDAAAPKGQEAPAPDGVAAGPQAAAVPAAPPAAEASSPANPSAYPFDRPSASSLAAWGIKPSQAGAQPGAQPGAQAASKAPATQASAQAQKPAAPQAPQYDFVFQVAAFKSADDADKLRKKLEERGIRTRLEKSGKVQLVMVNLRGTDLDATNLREELGRMKLGAPIQKSKKAVPGKSRSTGR
ncbi:SPOR domain-containing protein [Desulfovibrio sp. 86]|uniref:Sporulation domain protein n=1 Tax=uncultured Desulfovibrio sp. TaxID=167968 RepID=A0A212L8Z9_9BACT|nr:SPOR domain-containing protein [Desulfovibrio sp. 86]SCM74016.1 Sporulation domain protein [uncultured Desulfovibrio sp.]VZH34586.1 Sporulation domain protein [Desulfovibrio sp. 86]